MAKTKRVGKSWAERNYYKGNVITYAIGDTEYQSKVRKFGHGICIADQKIVLAVKIKTKVY